MHALLTGAPCRTHWQPHARWLGNAVVNVETDVTRHMPVWPQLRFKLHRTPCAAAAIADVHMGIKAVSATHTCAWLMLRFLTHRLQGQWRYWQACWCWKVTGVRRLWFWHAPQNRRFLPDALYSDTGGDGDAPGVIASCIGPSWLDTACARQDRVEDDDKRPLVFRAILRAGSG